MNTFTTVFPAALIMVSSEQSEARLQPVKHRLSNIRSRNAGIPDSHPSQRCESQAYQLNLMKPLN